MAVATLSLRICQSGKVLSLANHSTVRKKIQNRSVWHCSQSGSLAKLPIWKVLFSLAAVPVWQSGKSVNLGAVWQRAQSGQGRSLQTHPNLARSPVWQSGSLARYTTIRVVVLALAFWLGREVTIPAAIMTRTVFAHAATPSVIVTQICFAHAAACRAHIAQRPVV